MKMRVILDSDDVLFPCNEVAVDHLNKAEGTAYTLNDIKKWGFLGNKLDKRLSYFKDPSFIRNLQPYWNAQMFVAELAKMAEIFVATSVDPFCAGERVNSIIRHFPEINPENILIGNRKDLLQADVLLDDGVHNLTHSQAKYPVLYRRPWNEDTTGVLAVSNYYEFLQFVRMIQNKEETAEKPKIVAIVGPSGSGKTEVLSELGNHYGFIPVRTYTTRQPDIRHAKNYHFIDKEEFEEMTDTFFETSTDAGEWFGLNANDIYQIINAGKIAVLMLDVNGAIALKRAFGKECLTVYLKRNKRDCISAILSRNLPLEETVSRIDSLDAEMKNEEFCDICIENNRVSNVIAKIKEETL